MTASRALGVTRIRAWSVLGLVFVAFATLAGRAVYLQYYQREFLQDQGDDRHERLVEIPAHRGMIVDRNGEPLAISTPVDSVWVDPRQVLRDRSGLDGVARLLDLDPEETAQRVEQRVGREFVYLHRHVAPALAQQVMDLDVMGVNLHREYRRYYPAGEVAGQLVGFTDIDDRGQEGVELAFEDYLRGRAGSKRVIRDRLGRVIEDVEQIRPPHAGHDLRLSLDRRIQFLAYRALKGAVSRHGARSGSLVVLDPRRGEVLAMVNQPAFNPNKLDARRPRLTRNRAVTDVFEPGSTVKPFTVAAALEAGLYRPQTLVDTAPGWFVVTGHTIRDMHDYGRITVAKVISKSSNVGASKMALDMGRESLWKMFSAVGLGVASGVGLPGESTGSLPDFRHWYPLDQATIAFGYGVSTTTLQLAQAYMVLATGGIQRPVSLVPVETPAQGRRVLSRRVTEEVRQMMEGVVSAEGTAPAAAVPGYRVAGKTGTVHKSIGGGYAKHRYVALFAGMVPASSPALVVVVVIDEPTRNGHYGGQVAAPAFAKVAEGALRILNIPPDATPILHRAGEGAPGGPA